MVVFPLAALFAHHPLFLRDVLMVVEHPEIRFVEIQGRTTIDVLVERWPRASWVFWALLPSMAWTWDRQRKSVSDWIMNGLPAGAIVKGKTKRGPQPSVKVGNLAVLDLRLACWSLWQPVPAKKANGVNSGCHTGLVRMSVELGINPVGYTAPREISREPWYRRFVICRRKIQALGPKRNSTRRN